MNTNIRKYIFIKTYGSMILNIFKHETRAAIIYCLFFFGFIGMTVYFGSEKQMTPSLLALAITNVLLNFAILSKIHFDRAIIRNIQTDLYRSLSRFKYLFFTFTFLSLLLVSRNSDFQLVSILLNLVAVIVYFSFSFLDTYLEKLILRISTGKDFLFGARLREILHSRILVTVQILILVISVATLSSDVPLTNAIFYISFLSQLVWSYVQLTIDEKGLRSYSETFGIRFSKSYIFSALMTYMICFALPVCLVFFGRTAAFSVTFNDLLTFAGACLINCYVIAACACARLSHGGQSFLLFFRFIFNLIPPVLMIELYRNGVLRWKSK